MTEAKRRELHTLCQAYRAEPLGPACEYAGVSDRYAAIERFVVQVERDTFRTAAEVVSKQSYRIAKVGTDVMTVIAKLEALADGKLETLNPGEANARNDE